MQRFTFHVTPDTPTHSNTNGDSVQQHGSNTLSTPPPPSPSQLVEVAIGSSSGGAVVVPRSLHIVIVMDVSSSMSFPPATKRASDVEGCATKTGLGLVKYAALAVSRMLGEGDYFSLIIFGTRTYTLLEHVPVDNNDLISSVIDSITATNGYSNLGSGFRAALECIVRHSNSKSTSDDQHSRRRSHRSPSSSRHGHHRHRSDSARGVTRESRTRGDSPQSSQQHGRRSHYRHHRDLHDTATLPTAPVQDAVLLLTDGAPNLRYNAVDVYRSVSQSHPDIMANTIINTFAFGSGKDICSELMFEIATRGNGVFSYVPDVSNAGTALIHTVANLRAVVAVVPEKGIHSVLNGQIRCGMADVEFSQYAVVPGMMREEYGDSYRPAKGIHGTIPGVVSMKAVKRAMMSYDDDNDNREMKENSLLCGDGEEDATIKPTSSSSLSSLLSSCGVELDVVAEGVLRSIHTQKVCICILRCMYTGSPNPKGGVGVGVGAVPSEKRFYSLLTSSKADLDILPHMAADIEQNVAPAFREPRAYNLWGKHYLHSFVSAHIHQQCTNSKDRSMEGYKTAFITSKCDEYNDILNKLVQVGV